MCELQEESVWEPKKKRGVHVKGEPKHSLLEYLSLFQEENGLGKPYKCLWTQNEVWVGEYWHDTVGKYLLFFTPNTQEIQS